MMFDIEWPDTVPYLGDGDPYYSIGDLLELVLETFEDAGARFVVISLIENDVIRSNADRSSEKRSLLPTILVWNKSMELLGYTEDA